MYQIENSIMDHVTNNLPGKHKELRSENVEKNSLVIQPWTSLPHLGSKQTQPACPLGH